MYGSSEGGVAVDDALEEVVVPVCVTPVVVVCVPPGGRGSRGGSRSTPSTRQALRVVRIAVDASATSSASGGAVVVLATAYSFAESVYGNAELEGEVTHTVRRQQLGH